MNETSAMFTLTDDTAILRQAYLRHLLDGHRSAAHRMIMAAVEQGLPIPEIYQDVFQESLYEVGRLWEANRISVADEHICTIITQYIMSDLYQRLELSDIRRGKLVMTGVQGELHQVGANMVADILEADGWDVMFLGADVPPPTVSRAIREHRADLLGISVTMSANIPKAGHLVTLVRREFGAQSPDVLLGGGAFLTDSDLPPELDGCRVARNLREARERSRTLYDERIRQS